MASSKPERTLKIKYLGKKSSLNVTQWLESSKESPVWVFDELYEQQESYTRIISGLEIKLSEYKARIRTLGRKCDTAEENKSNSESKSTESGSRNWKANWRFGIHSEKRAVLEAKKLQAREERKENDKIHFAPLNKTTNQKEGWEKYSLLAHETRVQAFKRNDKELLSQLAPLLQQPETCKSLVLSLEARLAVQEEQQHSQKARIADQKRQQEGWTADLEASSAAQKLWQEATKNQITDLENRLTRCATMDERGTSEAHAIETTHLSLHDNEITKALPDPSRLTCGVDPSLANWKYLIEMKLLENDDHFDTPGSRLSYVISRTSGAAQDQLITRLRSKNLPQVTRAKEAIEYSEMLYHEPELRTTDVNDFQRPGRSPDRFWEYFGAFVWNAAKHEIPEEKWNIKLHEYLQSKFVEDLGAFFSYEIGPPKELAKEAFLHLIRQQAASIDQARSATRD